MSVTKFVESENATKRAGLDATIKGKLVFSDGGKPLHAMKVALVSLSPELALGQAWTNEDGQFSIDYSTDKVKKGKTVLNVYEHGISYSDRGDLVETPRQVFSHKLGLPATSNPFDLGTVAVPYWVYDPNSPVVRAYTPPKGLPPEKFTDGRTKQVNAFIKEMMPRRLKHLFLNKLYRKWPSLASIQKDYPPNLTVKLEKERPGWTRTDEYLGERVLNGFQPCLFSRDRQNPDLLRVWWKWDSVEFHGEYDMPNVDARFQIRGQKIWPVRITLQFRQPGAKAAHAPLQPPVTYTPDDGVKWEQAKRVFRLVWALSGETDLHWCQTHLNGEQFAIAAHRNLRTNPVRLLLLPHLKEVTALNWRGDLLIFGPTGIMVKSTPLTTGSMVARFKERMGVQCWKGWRPRKPLTGAHQFAIVGEIYWEVLTAHVDEFIEQNRAEISKHWYEVHRFSRDLVEHSVDYRPLDADPDDDWFDTNELDKADIARQQVNGKLKAVRPITESDTPSEQDFQNLKEACRFILFQVTYVHSYTNGKQYDDGGEILYGPLGMRNGCMGSEDDHSVALRPSDATNQLFLARYLSETRYGLIMKDEDRDVLPRLIELLGQRKPEFDAVGFDITEIGSRTNI